MTRLPAATTHTTKDRFTAECDTGSANVVVELPYGTRNIGLMPVFISGLGDHTAVSRKLPRHEVASKKGMAVATIAMHERARRHQKDPLNERANDIMTGLDAIVAEYKGRDLKGFLLEGHSLGGIITNLVLKQNKQRPKEERFPIKMAVYDATPGTAGKNELSIAEMPKLVISGLIDTVSHPLRTAHTAGIKSKAEKEYDSIIDAKVLAAEMLALLGINKKEDIDLTGQDYNQAFAFYSRDYLVPRPRVLRERTFIPENPHLGHMATHERPAVMLDIIEYALQGLDPSQY